MIILRNILPILVVHCYRALFFYSTKVDSIYCLVPMEYQFVTSNDTFVPLHTVPGRLVWIEPSRWSIFPYQLLQQGSGMRGLCVRMLGCIGHDGGGDGSRFSYWFVITHPSGQDMLRKDECVFSMCVIASAVSGKYKVIGS